MREITTQSDTCGIFCKDISACTESDQAMPIGNDDGHRNNKSTVAAETQ